MLLSFWRRGFSNLFQVDRVEDPYCIEQALPFGWGIHTYKGGVGHYLTNLNRLRELRYQPLRAEVVERFQQVGEVSFDLRSLLQRLRNHAGRFSEIQQGSDLWTPLNLPSQAAG